MKKYIVNILNAIKEEFSIFTIVYLCIVALLLRGATEYFKNYEFITSPTFGYKIFAISIVMVLMFNKRLRSLLSQKGSRARILIIILLWSFVTAQFSEAMVKMLNIRFASFSKGEEKIAKYYYLEMINEKNTSKYKVTFWAESDEGNIVSVALFTDESMYKKLDKFRYGGKKDKVKVHYFIKDGFLRIPWVNKTDVFFQTDL